MAGNGDSAQGFRELFREHAPFVWRVLARHGIAESDLPDLCQEVFVVVHRKLPEFEGRSTLRTWLYGIAVRAAAGHRRRFSVRLERPTDAPPTLTDARTPEHSLGATRALSVLDAALSRVSAEQREAFVLFELEEMSLSEVARAQACAQATAFSRVKVARSALEAHLKRLEISESSALAWASRTTEVGK